jgi:uncharacterized membrane protein
MSISDMIGELRTGTPEPHKTGRWLRRAGFGCLAVVVLNLVSSHFLATAMSGLPVPPHFETGLLALAVTGILFLLAGQGVTGRQVRAVARAQTALVLLVGLIGACIYWLVGVPGQMGFPRAADPRNWFFALWTAAGIVVFLQLAVPAFFAFRYLRRLKAALAAGAGQDPPSTPAARDPKSAD